MNFSFFQVGSNDFFQIKTFFVLVDLDPATQQIRIRIRNPAEEIVIVLQTKIKLIWKERSNENPNQSSELYVKSRSVPRKFAPLSFRRKRNLEDPNGSQYKSQSRFKRI